MNWWNGWQNRVSRDDEKREVIETVDGDETQIEVKMTRDDLNEAIKQTAISVSASMQQQRPPV